MLACQTHDDLISIAREISSLTKNPVHIALSQYAPELVIIQAWEMLSHSAQLEILRSLDRYQFDDRYTMEQKKTLRMRLEQAYQSEVPLSAELFISLFIFCHTKGVEAAIPTWLSDFDSEEKALLLRLSEISKVSVALLEAAIRSAAAQAARDGKYAWQERSVAKFLTVEALAEDSQPKQQETTPIASGDLLALRETDTTDQSKRPELTPYLEEHTSTEPLAARSRELEQKSTTPSGKAVVEKATSLDSLNSHDEANSHTAASSEVPQAHVMSIFEFGAYGPNTEELPDSVDITDKLMVFPKTSPLSHYLRGDYQRLSASAQTCLATALATTKIVHEANENRIFLSAGCETPTILRAILVAAENYSSFTRLSYKAQIDFLRKKTGVAAGALNVIMSVLR